MSTSTIPEEILHKILLHHITDPEDQFCQFPQHSTPRWKRIPRTRPQTFPSDVLLVSKQWLRVGSPILYRNVCLWKPKHTESVARVLKAHPTLRQAVNCLRIEGGMGRDLAVVAELATNIRTVYFCANVPPSESCSGLRKALALMNPAILYVYFDLVHGGVRSSEMILPVLEHAVRTQWKRLDTVKIGNGLDVSRRFLDSVSQSPSLRSISLASFWYISILEPLAWCRSLREIRYSGSYEKGAIEQMLEDLEVPEHFATLFKYEIADSV